VIRAATSSFNTAVGSVHLNGPSQHISLPQVAQALHVPYRQVYELVLTGKLLARKIGGQWHVNPDSLADLLESRGLADKPGNE
jgi:hypothetical protein